MSRGVSSTEQRGEPCHIASLVAHCHPDNVDACIASVCEAPGASVPEHDPRGKLVVLIETPDEGELLDAIRHVERLPGVISASLVFHQIDHPTDA